MTDQYAGPGPQPPWPAWRRWQAAGTRRVAHGIVVPILAGLLVVLSSVLVGSQLGLLVGGSSYGLEAFLLGLRVLLWACFVVLLAVSIRRAVRLRRMFLEVGPHGVVQHDGREVAQIPWVAIDRLYEPRPGHLGLLLRDGRSVALVVPNKLDGVAEVQAARDMILGQLGHLGQPPLRPAG